MCGIVSYKVLEGNVVIVPMRVSNKVVQPSWELCVLHGFT